MKSFPPPKVGRGIREKFPGGMTLMIMSSQKSREKILAQSKAHQCERV